MFDKLVVVTRKTRLEELIARFNTRAQAKFYIEHAGGDFGDYEREDLAYRRSLDLVRHSLEVGLKIQLLDRSLVPTYIFAPQDLVVTLGQDGLVANTAKYVGAQPIVAVNPDRERFDGVLLPFAPEQAYAAVSKVVEGKHDLRSVTLAEATLEDGQRLLAFNDLYMGSQTHVSSRYRIGWRGATEPHSSSGVVVSTGAGSTGWMSSILGTRNTSPTPGGRLEWEDRRLLFAVREPFVSRHSSASLVGGLIEPAEELRFESAMPSGGVIFSDGVEADYMAFNSGAIAHIRAAEQRAQLVVG